MKPRLYAGLVLSVTAIVLTIVVTGVAAQDAVPGDALRLFATVTPKKVQLKIDEIESNKELDDSTKSRLLGLYRQARASLEALEFYDATEKSYRKAADEAPREIAKIRALLRHQPKRMQKYTEKQMSALTLQDLEQHFSAVQAEAAALDAEATSLDDELREQRLRPSEVREEVTRAKQALDSIVRDLRALKSSQESPAVVEARRTAFQAGWRMRMKEIDMLSAALSTYMSRVDLLAAHRSLLNQKLAQVQQELSKVEGILTKRRLAEAERSRDATARAELAAAQKHPVLRKLAEVNLELGQQLTVVAEATTRATAERDTARSKLREVETLFKGMQERLDVAGLSRSIGLLLVNERRKLPDTRGLWIQLRKQQEEVSGVWLEQLRIEDEETSLTDLDQAAGVITADLGREVAAEKRQEIEIEVRDLLRDRQALLNRLLNANSSYLNVLGDLETNQKRIIEKTEQFKEFLDQWVLWVPNVPPLKAVLLDSSIADLKTIFAPSSWARVLRALATEARQTWSFTLMAGITILALLVSRRRMFQSLDSIADRVADPLTDSIGITLKALAITGLLSFPLPLLLWYVGFRLQDAPGSDEFVHAVGRGVRGTTRSLFFLQASYWLCRARGVAEAHFKWQRNGLQVWRHNVSWYTAVFVLSLFLLIVSGRVNDELLGSLGRMSFMVMACTSSLFAWRVFSPHGGVFEHYIAENPRGWVARLRMLWFPSLVLAPLSYAGLAAAGYLYTASSLMYRVASTLWLVAGGVMTYSLIVRWLSLMYRKLEVKAAEERQARAQAALIASGGKEVEAAHDGATHEIDFPTASKNATKLLKALLGTVMLVGLYFIWAQVLPAVSVFDKITLWHYSSKVSGKEVEHSITLLNVAAAIVILGVTLSIARYLPSMVEVFLSKGRSVTSGGGYAVARIARYTVISIGIVILFNSLGGSWGQIQWLVAALGVGLGFGLQEIFGNFISGLIILFEQPIRVGDVVTMGAVSGRVSRIQIRATTIIDFDNKELIVPNKSIITGNVVNWTLSHTSTRITINVGIAYGSDTVRAHEVMLATVRDNPLVLRDPAPHVFFTGFGENSLDFTVFVFAKDPSERMKLAHELHMAIEKSLREKGIEIPFPQRDIYIRSMPEQCRPANGKDGQMNV